MTTNCRERVAFVPTAFFAEFLAGGAYGQDNHCRYTAKHTQRHGDIMPALPSRGR